MTDRERVARAIRLHRMKVPGGEIEWALLLLNQIAIQRPPAWTPDIRADVLDAIEELAQGAADAALAAMPTWRRIPDEVREGEAPRLWRHKKRGTVYTEVGLASLQVATERPREGDPLVIYRGDDGQLWARARIEFEDGRFEPISPLPAPPAGEVG